MPTLVFFGDRITYKIDNEQQETTIPSLIREEMTSWVVIDSTVHGASSRKGMATLQEDVLLHNPDLCMILFGIHDARTFNPVSLKEYETNLRYMVKKITPSRTILITPTPIRQVDASEADHLLIESYANTTEKVANDTGSKLINLWGSGATQSQTIIEDLVNHAIDKMSDVAAPPPKKNLFARFNPYLF